MKNVFIKVASAAAITVAMASANATPIIGIGNLTFGDVEVSLGELDWNLPLNPGLNLVTKTYGDFILKTSVSTGSFNIPTNTAGHIQDMSQNPADINFVGLGSAPTPVTSFFKFVARPFWQFDATYLTPGNTFGLFTSPYILTESGGNVSATITLKGTACDAGATGSTSVCDLTDDLTNWTAILSAQYTNTSIANMVATLTSGNALQNNTWSGTIEATAIPEPGSLALLGLGLVGLVVGRRRTAK